MRHTMVVFSLLVLLVTPGSVVSAQEAAPAVRTDLVRLDAVVTDAKGQLVRGLSGSDFVLLEDGKPQTLTHFIFVGSAEGDAAAAKAPATAPTPLAPAMPQGPGRSIVLIIDDLHISTNNLQYTKPALVRFVAQTVQPEDRVALVLTSSPGSVRQLSGDRAQLEQAIQGLTSREAIVGAARGSAMTPAEAEMVLRGDLSATRLAARALMTEPGSVYESGPRSAVEGGPAAAATAGLPSVTDDAKERAAAQEARRQADMILAEATRFSRVTLDTVADVVRSIAEVPGRKICLVVSDGFLLGMGTRSDQTQFFRGVIDAATRSGTVVYTLDSRGLAMAGGDASTGGAAVPAGLQQNVDHKAVLRYRETLSALAGDTGGFLIHGTNEPTPALQRMLADNEAYYLMAYEPANTKRDGRFRRIELKLPGRSGLTVRTRTGYFAPDDKARAAAKPVTHEPAPAGLQEAEARSVLGATVPAKGIPVSLTVDYLDLPPAGAQALVRAQVDVNSLPWREVEGRRRADVDLVGGVFDASGALTGSPFTRHVALDLTKAEQEMARKAGLQMQQRVPVQPGRQTLRLVVVGANLAPLGGAAQSIDVPNLADQKLALSSVFLATSAKPAGGPAADGAGVGETLRDVQVSRSFKRGEGLYFQLYVYNVAPDADVVLQAQIRSGEKLVGASKPQPVTVQQKDGVLLPQSNGMSLEGFASGRYELRVVVVDRKTNLTVFRAIDFTVE
jgi:VWFA-related protein